MLFFCVVALCATLLGLHLKHSPSPTPTNGRVTREQIDEAISSLETVLRPALTASTDCRALALGLRGLGPSFEVGSQPLMDRLLDCATKAIEKGPDDRYRFTHTTTVSTPALLLSALLESGTKLDRPLSTTNANTDLASLAGTFIAEARLATTDDEWASFGWTLDALSLALSHQIQSESGQPKLQSFSEASLGQLVRENQRFKNWIGHGAISDSAISELASDASAHRGIYRLEGAGLHLLQALMRGNTVLRDERTDRSLRRLLNTTLFRYRLERPMWRRLLDESADRQRTLTQAIDYTGHLLEVLGTTELLAAHDTETEGLETTLSEAAADLVGYLAAFPSGEQLAALPGVSPEAYFAELGAASSALRGLRLARRFAD